MSTFVEGAAAAVPVALLTSAIGKGNRQALQSVALVGLGGGIAAVLSFMQHAGSPVSAHGTSVQPFIFRGPDGAGTDRAAYDLQQFVRLAGDVSDATWNHHLQANDHSKWIRSSLKDAPLADQEMQIERSADAMGGTRQKVIAALQGVYGIPSARLPEPVAQRA